MPSMEHVGNDIWSKQCTVCKNEFSVTGKIWDEAHVNMRRFFGVNSKVAYDNLQVTCRGCDSDRRARRPIGKKNRLVLLSEQNGKCSICDKQIDFDLRTANIDHCHTTRKVRGIVCIKCNTGMAFIDNNEWLLKAIAYRDSYRDPTTMEISDAQRILQEESEEQDED